MESKEVNEAIFPESTVKPTGKWVLVIFLAVSAEICPNPAFRPSGIDQKSLRFPLCGAVLRHPTIDWCSLGVAPPFSLSRMLPIGISGGACLSANHLPDDCRKIMLIPRCVRAQPHFLLHWKDSRAPLSIHEAARGRPVRCRRETRCVHILERACSPSRAAVA
jgi:hypothetical protein